MSQVTTGASTAAFSDSASNSGAVTGAQLRGPSSMSWTEMP
jgi:hypothetical protein